MTGLPLQPGLPTSLGTWPLLRVSLSPWPLSPGPPAHGLVSQGPLCQNLGLISGSSPSMPTSHLSLVCFHSRERSPPSPSLPPFFPPSLSCGHTDLSPAPPALRISLPMYSPLSDLSEFYNTACLCVGIRIFEVTSILKQAKYLRQ